MLLFGKWWYVYFDDFLFCKYFYSFVYPLLIQSKNPCFAKLFIKMTKDDAPYKPHLELSFVLLFVFSNRIIVCLLSSVFLPRLTISLSFCTIFPSYPGLTVLSLSNERYAFRSLCSSVFALHCSQYYLFYQKLNCVTPSFSLQCSVSACLLLLEAQLGKWTATDEAHSLSTALEGINHDSVSALMRIQRSLLEIQPSGASDSSWSDSCLRQDT